LAVGLAQAAESPILHIRNSCVSVASWTFGRGSGRFPIVWLRSRFADAWFFKDARNPGVEERDTSGDAHQSEGQ
jgi:hypothetical protein